MILNRNLDIYQGDDFFHTINLYDTDGSLFVFGSQHSFAGKIRKAGETTLDPPGVDLATITCEKVLIGENTFESGVVNLSISDAITKDIPPGRHWYEIRFITDQGEGIAPKVLTLFSGLAIVYPEVTKDE